MTPATKRDEDTRLRQTLNEIAANLLKAPVDGVADADLYGLLRELETYLGSDHPCLEVHQKRRDAYLGTLWQTLNELAAMLRAPQVELAALQQCINDLREAVGTSPYTGLFAKLEQQLAAHRNEVAALNAFLQRPIQDWLNPTLKIHEQASTLRQI